jgi:hypothetical protein
VTRPEPSRAGILPFELPGPLGEWWFWAALGGVGIVGFLGYRAYQAKKEEEAGEPF